MTNDELARLQALLERLRAGDEKAKSDLIEHACERLRRLTKKMLRDYARVRRWEETDDVLQQAALRLVRSLSEVAPASPSHFFALAATQIRRTLLDLARHYYGPEGSGAHHHTDDTGGDLPKMVEQAAAAGDGEPQTLQQWTLFHEKIDELPEKEREVFQLLWYQGLTQGEAAEILEVDVRTIKRRWQAARIQLHETLDGTPPPG
jgi:RNA polymerase sigma factor (sigma-70 family)